VADKPFPASPNVTASVPAWPFTVTGPTRGLRLAPLPRFTLSLPLPALTVIGQAAIEPVTLIVSPPLPAKYDRLSTVLYW